MQIIGGHRDDPRHWLNHFRVCPQIKLNGDLVEHVSEADDVAGYIEVAQYENGKLKLDESGERILYRRIEGVVEIIGDRITDHG